VGRQVEGCQNAIQSPGPATNVASGGSEALL